MKVKAQIHFVATDPRTDPWVIKKLNKSKGEKDYFLSLKIIEIDNRSIKSTQDFFDAVNGYFPKIIAGNRLLNDLFVNVTLPPGAEDITHITLGNFPDFRMDRDTKNDIDTIKVKRAESLQNEIVEFDISPDDFELVTTCDVSEICDVSKISLKSGKITKASTVGFNRDAVLNIKPSSQIQEQLKSQSKKVFGENFELWNAQKQAVPYHITIAQTNQFSKTLHQIEASSKIERLSKSINSLKTDEKYTEELKRRDQNKLSEMNADNSLEKLKDLQDALFQIVMQQCGADHSHIGIYVTREFSRMRMLGDFFKEGLFDLLYNLFTAERGLIIHNWNNLTSEKYHIPCILLALEAEKKDLVSFLLKNECDLKLPGALSKLIEAMKNKGYLKADDVEKFRIKIDSKEGSLITGNEIISAIQWKSIGNMPLPTTSHLIGNPISFFANPQIKNLGKILANEKFSTTAFLFFEGKEALSAVSRSPNWPIMVR
jgi:predicted house-cleaning noncanonical NTP pyrophosphatase (MazG superfamily)